MSDTASNKKLIEQIFAAAGNPDPTVRDRALFAASLADDAIWTVTGQYSWSRTFTGKQSIMNDLHGHVRTRLAERTRTIAHRFIADGDHEYWPVTVQMASSARLAANNARSRTVGSGLPAAAKICSISFLLLAVSLMAASLVG